MDHSVSLPALRSLGLTSEELAGASSAPGARAGSHHSLPPPKSVGSSQSNNNHHHGSDDDDTASAFAGDAAVHPGPTSKERPAGNGAKKGGRKHGDENKIPLAEKQAGRRPRFLPRFVRARPACDAVATPNNHQTRDPKRTTPPETKQAQLRAAIELNIARANAAVAERRKRGEKEKRAAAKRREKAELAERRRAARLARAIREWEEGPVEKEQRMIALEEQASGIHTSRSRLVCSFAAERACGAGRRWGRWCDSIVPSPCDG